MILASDIFVKQAGGEAMGGAGDAAAAGPGQRAFGSGSFHRLIAVDVFINTDD